MAGKNTAVFGIYGSRLGAEDGVSALRESGFRVEDMSVLLPENLGSKDLTTQKATKSPEGATVGAGTGAVIGGVLGLLAGIGALAIPGFGPLIAAGPIMAALAGVGAGGVVGGLTGALVGMGIPEYEAKRYEGRVKTGGILVSVHCDDSDWTKKAKVIMERTGAEDISSTGESSADYGESDRPGPRTTTVGGTAVAGDYREYELDFRNHYQTIYASRGGRYEDYSAAYEFGCRMADDSRYRGRNFSDVESDLRRNYESQHPEGTWERMKESIRYGWDRLTGKARGAGR
jgi:hypothetical protein